MAQTSEITIKVPLVIGADVGLEVRLQAPVMIDDRAAEVLNRISSFKAAELLAGPLELSAEEIGAALNTLHFATAGLIRARDAARKAFRRASA